MSVINTPLLNGSLAQHLFLSEKSISQRKYAFRIGFVGGPLNRYDEGLIGKVIDAQTFETLSGSQNSMQRSTLEAKRILSSAISSYYPSSRQRLIHAGLTGTDELERGTNFERALRWLGFREIDAIYFQYPWMVNAVMEQRVLGMNYRPITKLAVIP